jgi:hypothetical protein
MQWATAAARAPRTERLRGMLALIAVQEAVASGLGTGLLPAIGTGTLDGFAAGMLLSGAVFLVLMASRHGTLRPRRAFGSRLRIGRPRRSGREGYQSKHRLAEPEEGSAWPESRRGAPRHAAPSSALVSRLAFLTSARALSTTD